MAEASSVESAASDLYALDLGAFTAERKRLAAGLTGDDRALIAGLPKPSAAAWLVNQLVRAEPDAVAAALELGVELRAAQSALDRDALRELTARRRDALRDLADAARRVSADRGRPLSSAIADDVEQTFVAGIADEAAGAAVRSGRLVRALQSIGGEPVDLEGAVAAPGEELPAGAAAGRGRGAAGSGGVHAGGSRGSDGGGARGATGSARPDPRVQARSDVAAAHAQADAARAGVDSADEELAAAAARHAELVEERDRLLAEAERLEREVADAERRRREAFRIRDRAGRQLEGAQRVVQRAEARLEALDG
ncbi:MAG: hypothetical protein ACTHKX_08765 [Pseudolysinimonas sp.]